MPKRYEAIRNKLQKKGVPKKKSQKQAGKIHNATKKANEPAAGKHRKRKK